MLQVEAIDFHYGASQALRQVSLSAEPGRVTCVMGRNGVGKTTLLRAIVGQQMISAGRILWEGADISALAAYQRAARGIAYVPQGREIFPLLSVRENLYTGYPSLPRPTRTLPEEIFPLFPALRDLLGDEGDRVPLLYGGSVNATNAEDFAAQTSINGALVGGASLDADSFLAVAAAFAGLQS